MYISLPVTVVSLKYPVDSDLPVIAVVRSGSSPAWKTQW
jgi:hypothetical protein